MLLFRTGLGVGDCLMASGVLRAWARRHRHRVVVETRYPELFHGHPDVLRVWPAGRVDRLFENVFAHPVVWRAGHRARAWIGSHSLIPRYPETCRGMHIMDAMAGSLGITLGPDERRPFLPLTDAERGAQRWADGWIAVQSSSASYWTVNKGWVPGRMQEVVNAVTATGRRMVQIGGADDVRLEGTRDLRGASLRETGAVLASAALMVGFEGGMMHLATSAACRSVVIYTGHSRPEESGYPENLNLRDPDAGDSCWAKDACSHCQKSSEQITSQAVVAAVLSVLFEGAAQRNVTTVP